MQAQMLAPSAVLVLWSVLMVFWMAATRFPAISKAEKGSITPKPGIRGQDLEPALPDKVNWKSHNYTHLMEQPTIFYPAVIILAIMGPAAVDVLLAWVYVALRIIHSLWQSLVNTIPVRIGLFTLSSLALAALAVRAVMATLFFDPGVAP
ncbi:MAPEG family protein [Altererythrobacter lutimaris]|uniref:MAPEG family protein n=1 Tax=Altererythrobacter lutimaris TaxID=2743979 RepID=A0A850HA31_9SPHN|nr:MAPEG family protein [Altererythrobacter lutimaris]NVE94330.1 MAPEG family protein [Altererythrobacter lutimaris]